MYAEISFKNVSQDQILKTLSNKIKKGSKIDSEYKLTMITPPPLWNGWALWQGVGGHPISNQNHATSRVG